MFIAWEQRFAFEDTLAAFAWQRGATDHHRIPALWSYQYASKEDPVRDRLSDIRNRAGS